MYFARGLCSVHKAGCIYQLRHSFPHTLHTRLCARHDGWMTVSCSVLAVYSLALDLLQPSLPPPVIWASTGNLSSYFPEWQLAGSIRRIRSTRVARIKHFWPQQVAFVLMDMCLHLIGQKPKKWVPAL